MISAAAATKMSTAVVPGFAEAMVWSGDDFNGEVVRGCKCGVCERLLAERGKPGLLTPKEAFRDGVWCMIANYACGSSGVVSQQRDFGPAIANAFSRRPYPLTITNYYTSIARAEWGNRQDGYRGRGTCACEGQSVPVVGYQAPDICGMGKGQFLLTSDFLKFAPLYESINPVEPNWFPTRCTTVYLNQISRSTAIPNHVSRKQHW